MRHPSPTRFGLWAALVALAALIPAPSRAQVVWDGPMMMSPGSPAGWGLHVIEPALTGGSSDGIGGLFTWRSNPAPVGLGFRVGVTESVLQDAALVAGLDVAGQVYSLREEDYDMDVIWFAGAGAGFDEFTTLSFPVGISVGWGFRDEGFALRPYLAPRMVIDARIGDPPGGDIDDLDLGFALEIGADLAFDSRFGIRAAGSFVDREALSIGVTFPGFLQ